MTLRDDFEIGILEVDMVYFIHIIRTVPIFDAKDSHLAAAAVIIFLTNATICINALLGNHFFHAISDGDGAASAIISRSDASCIIAAAVICFVMEPISKVVFISISSDSGFFLSHKP